jgi:DNA-binding response OmpR family regulator
MMVAKAKQVILTVDDDPNNLAVVMDCLTECNYTILVAEDGESAIARADYARPDLILLDVMMPGIDGYETCRRLKAQKSTRETPVIFMTALAETGHKVKGLEAGGVDYITKPFQREELLARIAVHLQLKELTSRLS